MLRLIRSVDPRGCSTSLYQIKIIFHSLFLAGFEYTSIKTENVRKTYIHFYVNKIKSFLLAYVSKLTKLTHLFWPFLSDF